MTLRDLLALFLGPRFAREQPASPPLTVVGWTSPKDPRPTAKEDHAHVQAVIEELRRTRNRHGGTWHLNAEDGCPVMSDGTVYRTTLRGWAVLVSIAHGGTVSTYAWEWGEDE